MQEPWATLAQLKQLTSDSQDQQRRIGLLEKQIKSRLAFLERVIEATLWSKMTQRR
jgi:CHASE3 domain sensor protein